MTTRHNDILTCLLATLLLAACTSDTPVAGPDNEPWSMTCTRTDLTGPVLLSLRYNATDHYGKLVPTSAEATDPTFSWENPTTPPQLAY